MTKNEFLEGLKEALSETGSSSLVRENLEYYDSYIEDEKKKGRTEQEILDELGDPRLIAKSIMDAGGYEDNGVPEEGSRPADEKTPDDQDQGSFRSFSGGHGCFTGIIPLLVVILLFALIFFLLVGTIRIFSPILLPILLVCLVFLLISKSNR